MPKRVRHDGVGGEFRAPFWGRNNRLLTSARHAAKFRAGEGGSMLRALLASVLLLASGAGAAQSNDTPVITDMPQRAKRLPATDLDWLTGDWQAGSTADGTTIEHWEPMRGGTKLGVGQTVKSGITRGFEYMRI